MLEIMFANCSDKWASILKSDDPKNLIILLESSRVSEIEKYIFTWENENHTGHITTWNPHIDNRYTTKKLSELKLIEYDFEESIETKQLDVGVAKKHRYIIKCTDEGLKRASEISKKLFKKDTIRDNILDNIEPEDFPDKWEFLIASFEVQHIPADTGPTIIDNDWWSGEPGYY